MLSWAEDLGRTPGSCIVGIAKYLQVMIQSAFGILSQIVQLELFPNSKVPM